MTAVIKKREPSAAFSKHAAKLSKPLHEFGREIDCLSSITNLKTESAALVTKEFKKLAPKLRHIGIEIKIQGHLVIVKQSNLATQVLSSEAKVVPNLTNREPFDPDKAGLMIIEHLKQEEGGSFTTAELKSRYDLSSSTLHRRRKEHRIIFWRDAKHDFQYPKWQFTASGAELEGIPTVLKIFKSNDEWRIMRYFLSPRHQLGNKSPLELLRAGKAAQVIAHAIVHEKENTW